jgi:hypothetical protein
MELVIIMTYQIKNVFLRLKMAFRLMNDPKQYEKERFIDSINVFNSIIEEFQKMYEQTPAADRLARDEILDGMSSRKET